MNRLEYARAMAEKYPQGTAFSVTWQDWYVALEAIDRMRTSLAYLEHLGDKDMKLSEHSTRITVVTGPMTEEMENDFIDTVYEFMVKRGLKHWGVNFEIVSEDLLVEEAEDVQANK